MFSLFLPYLSICLDVRPPYFFQSFPPAAFVTWGGNSAGLNATVFRGGWFHGFKLEAFPPEFLFPIILFFLFSFFFFSFHLLITVENPKKQQTWNSQPVSFRCLAAANIVLARTSYSCAGPTMGSWQESQTYMCPYILQCLALFYWNRHVTPHYTTELYLLLCSTTNTTYLWNMFQNAVSLWI